MAGMIAPEELAEETTSVSGEEEVAAPAAAVPPVPEDELAAVRELVLRAHPDAVPELVSGATVGELLASVEPARAAYARVAERIAPAAAASAPVVPSVPAGGAGPAPLDPDRLPAPEKIRRGLATRG